MVETCPEESGSLDARVETVERIDVGDAEASMPLWIETAVEFCPRMAVGSMETVKGISAVDICSERMYAVDAEVSMPLRIETAVEFCPRVPVEYMEAAMDVCPERVDTEAAVLRFFWRTRKKKKQKQEAADES